MSIEFEGKKITEAGVMDLGAKRPVHRGIKFANPDSGQEMMVEVHDKWPHLGDTHIEGRQYIEVSVEMFIGLVQGFGWLPVIPGQEEGN